MAQKRISVPLVSQAFAAGTTDPGFTVVIVGTLADGSSYSNSTVISSLDQPVEVPVGTGFVATVSKLGFSSQPSDPFDVVEVPAQITLSVPDATTKPTVS